MQFIYALKDPRNNEVKYIGKTKNLEQRLKAHLGCRLRSKKTSWIKSLKSLGLEPVMEIVEMTENPNEREVFWIDFYNKKTPLLNMTVGGTGGTTHCGKPRRVKNELGQIFNSIKMASESTGILESSICNVVRGKRHAVNGVRWAYEENDFREKKEKEDPIYCSNGKVYKNKKTASGELGLELYKINQCLRKRQNATQGLSFWRSTTSPKEPTRLGKPVRELTEGKEFKNAMDAARQLGLCNKQISQQLRGKQKHVKGFVFEFKK